MPTAQTPQPSKLRYLWWTIAALLLVAAVTTGVITSLILLNMLPASVVAHPLLWPFTQTATGLAQVAFISSLTATVSATSTWFSIFFVSVNTVITTIFMASFIGLIYGIRTAIVKRKEHVSNEHKKDLGDVAVHVVEDIDIDEDKQSSLLFLTPLPSVVTSIAQDHANDQSEDPFPEEGDLADVNDLDSDTVTPEINPIQCLIEDFEQWNQLSREEVIERVNAYLEVVKTWEGNHQDALIALVNTLIQKQMETKLSIYSDRSNSIVKCIHGGAQIKTWLDTILSMSALEPEMKVARLEEIETILNRGDLPKDYLKKLEFLSTHQDLFKTWREYFSKDEQTIRYDLLQIIYHRNLGDLNLFQQVANDLQLKLVNALIHVKPCLWYAYNTKDWDVKSETDHTVLFEKNLSACFVLSKPAHALHNEIAKTSLLAAQTYLRGAVEDAYLKLLDNQELCKSFYLAHKKQFDAQERTRLEAEQAQRAEVDASHSLPTSVRLSFDPLPPLKGNVEAQIDSLSNDFTPKLYN